MKRIEYAERLLRGWSAPKKRRNKMVLLAWMQAEGNSARCNPLNTTQKTEHSTPLAGNTAGVQEYPTMQEGIGATVKTRFAFSATSL